LALLELRERIGGVGCASSFVCINVSNQGINHRIGFSSIATKLSQDSCFAAWGSINYLSNPRYSLSIILYASDEIP
jgi:hypothetical protein